MGITKSGQKGMRLSPDHPKGLGGWLALIQIGLYVTCIRTFILIYDFFINTRGSEGWYALTSPGSADYHTLWKPTLIFEVSANIILLLASVYLLTLLYNKRAVFPRWLIFYYIIGLLLQVVIIALVASIPQSSELANGNLLQNIARGLVNSLIWTTYILRSKRVRNTFVN
ncbi:DUF2569 domain-containing protein [Paenibacillus sp. FSL R7-0345]|uniref:DUF2569 domain-containing protein n=1 Tax=Paenibacillus sp. FSL R7-0345 TaxID=2954535 RepID=UPI00315AC7BD